MVGDLTSCHFTYQKLAVHSRCTLSFMKTQLMYFIARFNSSVWLFNQTSPSWCDVLQEARWGCDPWFSHRIRPHDSAEVGTRSRTHKSPTIYWYHRITVQHLLFRPFAAYRATIRNTGWETICHLFLNPTPGLKPDNHYSINKSFSAKNLFRIFKFCFAIWKNCLKVIRFKCSIKLIENIYIYIYKLMQWQNWPYQLYDSLFLN